MFATVRAQGRLRSAEEEEIRDVIDAALDAASEAGVPLTEKNACAFLTEQARLLGLRLTNGQMARAAREAVRSYEHHGE